MVRCCVIRALNDQPMLHWVEQALACCLERTEMILVQYLNVHLQHPCNRRKNDLVTAIASRGLQYQMRHFIPMCRYRDVKGQVWSICRYIIPVVTRGDTSFVTTYGNSTTSASYNTVSQQTKHRGIKFTAKVYPPGPLRTQRGSECGRKTQGQQTSERRSKKHFALTSRRQHRYQRRHGD